MTRHRWVAIALMGGAVAQDPGRCFIDVQAAASAFVEQPVAVAVTIGWDRDWFEEYSVAMVRRRTDVPLYVEVPWLEESAQRSVTVRPVPTGQPTASIAVGGRSESARVLPDVVRDGRVFCRVELRFRWLPLLAGRREIEPSRLRYAYATEFRDHLLRGREPVNRREASVVGEAGVLEVRAFAGDAPEDFSGAVGDFQVEVTSGGQEVAVGEVFSVLMRIDGDEATNLERFRKPVIGSPDGFHVQGVLEVSSDGGRAFEISLLALRAGQSSVDGLSFVTYQPSSESFQRLGGESVPVRVVDRRDGVQLPDSVEELIRLDAASQRSGGDGLWWAFVGLAVAGLLVVRSGRRRRQRVSLAADVGELRAAVSAGDAVRIAAAFESFLARVGGGGPFAAPIIWESLQRRGVAAEGIARLKELHAALDHARFGGPLPHGGDVLLAVETVHEAIQS